MNSLIISLEDISKRYQPGALVKGSAEWNMLKDCGAAALHLLWYTEGVGTKDAEVVETIQLHGGQRSGRASFEFKLPNAPYSYSGKLVSIIWAVELQVDGADDVAREVITVLPDSNRIFENINDIQSTEI